MTRKLIYITPILLVLLFAMALGYVGEDIKLLLSPQYIIPGIKVMDVDIGGLKKQQAIERLNQLQKELVNTPVNINYNEESWSLNLSNVGLKMDVEKTITRAMLIGREGSIIERWQMYRCISDEGYVLQPFLQVDSDLLTKEINHYAGHLNIRPQNASLLIDKNDRIRVLPSKNGKSIDIKKLQTNLELELLSRKQIELSLPVTEVKPEYTTQNIKDMGITGLLASYTTKFNPDLTNRSYNIRVAANALDGLIITPGEEVSFNEVVGPRSTETGYKSAGVIENNELVEGVGGGVCQVSTTLYNTVLLAGLEVSERRNHSLPISYVPIGRDATVVYGLVDFKFLNNSGRCLYLKTEVKPGELKVKIFGDVGKKQKVIINSWVEQKLEPDTVYEEDSNLKKGQQVVKQEGSKGYVVNSERVIYKNGEVIKRQQLPMSRYNAIDKVIAVGTAEQEDAIIPPQGMNIKSDQVISD